jgi:cell fate regulator YaaT (PSP1 superfamily)
MSDVIGVQLLEGGKIQYYLSPGQSFRIDALCVVETEHGPSMARVVKSSVPPAESKGAEPLRRVMRGATAKDLEQVKHNERLERDAYRLCRKLVMDKGLSMKLVDVTYTLDSRKAIFYFTSENRVDFRELVKELAHALKVKIEMRQIGVRDEARRLGGVGCCGQALCCCTFLKDFVSVSIRMAKDQNVSLNPTKVSGICGRLMCCLSYEYEGAKAKQRKLAGEGKPGGEPEAACAAGQTCPGCANAPEAAGTKEAVKPAPPARSEKPQPAPAPAPSSAPAGQPQGQAPKNQPGNQPRRWFKQRQDKKHNHPPAGGNGNRGNVNKGPQHGPSRGPQDKR